jgi:hypothetical protein
LDDLSKEARVIEFYLCHDPKDKLGEWRLTVEAHFSGETPWAAYAEALKALRGAATGIDGLVVPRLSLAPAVEPVAVPCARHCEVSKTNGTGL